MTATFHPVSSSQAIRMIAPGGRFWSGFGSRHYVVLSWEPT